MDIGDPVEVIEVDLSPEDAPELIPAEPAKAEVCSPSQPCTAMQTVGAAVRVEPCSVVSKGFPP